MSTSEFTSYIRTLTIDEQRELAELLEAEMVTERQMIKQGVGSQETFEELRIQHALVQATIELGWHADN
jgi:hypothetical protein